MARHYDAGYYSEWVTQQAQARERLWARRLAIIEERLSPGRLLDVGCGEGSFLVAAKHRGWMVEGAELSPHAAHLAADRLGQSIFCGEIWQASFAAHSFDVATIWHVLEHTTQPLKVLLALRNLLKPKGILAVAVPNVNDRLMQLAYRLVKGRKPKLFSLSDKEIHLFHFSMKTLKAMLAAAGFECFEIGPDNGVIEPAKRLINGVGVAIHRAFGVSIHNGLQAFARPIAQTPADGVPNPAAGNAMGCTQSSSIKGLDQGGADA